MSKEWKTFDLEDRLVIDFDIRDKHSDCEARKEKDFITWWLNSYGFSN